MAWEIFFYEDEKGKSSVKNFIQSFSSKKKLQKKILRSIDLLRDFGPKLTEPDVKHIDEDIWELRTIQNSNCIRIFYFIYSENRIILLNGFQKTMMRTPKKEITLAKKYRDDYKRRFEK